MAIRLFLIFFLLVLSSPSIVVDLTINNNTTHTLHVSHCHIKGQSMPYPRNIEKYETFRFTINAYISAVGECWYIYKNEIVSLLWFKDNIHEYYGTTDTNCVKTILQSNGASFLFHC